MRRSWSKEISDTAYLIMAPTLMFSIGNVNQALSLSVERLETSCLHSPRI